MSTSSFSLLDSQEHYNSVLTASNRLKTNETKDISSSISELIGRVRNQLMEIVKHKAQNFAPMDIIGPSVNGDEYNQEDLANQDYDNWSQEVRLAGYEGRFY